LWLGYTLKQATSIRPTRAEQHHLLREYMLEQTEAEGILGAID